MDQKITVRRYDENGDLTSKAVLDYDPTLWEACAAEYCRACRTTVEDIAALLDEKPLPSTYADHFLQVDPQNRLWRDTWTSYEKVVSDTAGIVLQKLRGEHRIYLPQFEKPTLPSSGSDAKARKSARSYRAEMKIYDAGLADYNEAVHEFASMNIPRIADEEWTLPETQEAMLASVARSAREDVLDAFAKSMNENLGPLQGNTPKLRGAQRTLPAGLIGEVKLMRLIGSLVVRNSIQTLEGLLRLYYEKPNLTEVKAEFKGWKATMVPNEDGPIHFADRAHIKPSGSASVAQLGAA